MTSLSSMQRAHLNNCEPALCAITVFLLSPLHTGSLDFHKLTMVEPRENVKWTLLDQAFRVKPPKKDYSVCFMKILFMDKYAFLLARVHKVFCARMEFDGYTFKFRISNRVCSRYCKNSLFTRKIPFKCDKFKKFFDMLAPKILCVNLEYTDNSSELSGLLDREFDRLAFEVGTIYKVPAILKTHWKRINELRCEAEVFEILDKWSDGSKVFDVLTIERVWSDEELARVLGQKAVVLNVFLQSYDEKDLPVSNAVVNATTTDFRLWGHSMDRVAETVRIVVGRFERLKRLDVYNKTEESINEQEFDQVLPMIKERYEAFCRTADIVNEYDIDSYFDCGAGKVYLINSTPPDNWREQVAACIGFEKFSSEPYRKYGTGLELEKLWVKGKRGKAEFKFCVICSTNNPVYDEEDYSYEE